MEERHFWVTKRNLERLLDHLQDGLWMAFEVEIIGDSLVGFSPLRTCRRRSFHSPAGGGTRSRARRAWSTPPTGRASRRG
jgi:hypothetical protein